MYNAPLKKKQEYIDNIRKYKHYWKKTGEAYHRQQKENYIYGGKIWLTNWGSFCTKCTSWINFLSHEIVPYQNYRVMQMWMIIGTVREQCKNHKNVTAYGCNAKLFNWKILNMNLALPFRKICVIKGLPMFQIPWRFAQCCGIWHNNIAFDTTIRHLAQQYSICRNNTAFGIMIWHLAQ